MLKIVVLAVLTVIVLGAIGAGAWLYAPDKSQASLERAYHVGPGDFVSVAGIRLHVLDEGRRDAPCLLLLHGFGSSLQTWDGWARDLAADHRVIRLDLPGFGLTGPDPTGDYSDSRVMQIMVALLDHLGVERVAPLGNSLGGRIAWMFAAQHPDRVDRLVLISPDGFASPGFAYDHAPDVPLLLRVLPYVLPRAILRATLVPAYGDPARLTEAAVSRYRDMMLAPGVRRAIIARTGQTILQDPVPLLRKIQAPTLLLWGEKDGMIPFANAAEYVRDIRMPHWSHCPGLGTCRSRKRRSHHCPQSGASWPGADGVSARGTPAGRR